MFVQDATPPPVDTVTRTLTGNAAGAGRASDAERAAAARIASITRRVAGNRRLRGADLDDVVQETTLLNLEGLRNRDESPTRFGATVSPVNLVRAQAKSALQRTQWRGTGVRSEDLRAFAILVDAAAEKSRALGRSVTPAEFDDLADGIRLRWPDGNRPQMHFQRTISARWVPIDTAVDLPSPALQPDELRWSDLPDAAAVLAAEASAIGQHRRQEYGVNPANAWNLFAEAIGEVPKVESGILTRTQKRKAEFTVEESGIPVSKLAEEGVERGRSASLRPAVDALLTPFRNAHSDRGCDCAPAIFETLASHPMYATRLWASALSIASRKQPCNRIHPGA